MADKVHIAGSLHCFFEGYFIVHHDRMGSRQDIIGQLWKEYALSDSRYMTADTLVLCMETITVVSSHFVPALVGCTDSIAPLGPSLLLGGLFNLQPTCTPASIPDHCLHEPSVRRRSVLRNESI